MRPARKTRTIAGVSRQRIGELLLEAQVLKPEQLQHALSVKRAGGGRRLGGILVELGYVNEMQLTQTLSRQLSVPWVSLYHIEFSRQLLNLVPREVAEQCCLVPIFVRQERKQGETLYVAMDDPMDEAALEEVRVASGLAVRPMIACPSDIRGAIRVYYGGAASQAQPESSTPAPATPAPHVSVETVRDAVLATFAMSQRVRKAGASSIPPASTTPSAPPEPRANEPPPAAKSRSKGKIPVPKADAADRPPARVRRLKGGARMLAVTLLDGSTLYLPAKRPRVEGGPAGSRPGDALSEEHTARDLIGALRALAHGADAAELLGDAPRWEALFAALLSLLLRKGLIADWEFIDELRKV